MTPSQLFSRYSSLDPPHYDEGGVTEPTITLKDASISYHLIPDAEDAEDIVDPVLAQHNWFLFHRKGECQVKLRKLFMCNPQRILLRMLAQNYPSEWSSTNFF